MEKINGPVLMGFKEWFDRDVTLGAAAANRPVLAKKPLPPKKVVKGAIKVPRTQTMEKHGQVLAKAKQTAAKAVKAALGALRTASAKPTPAAAKITHVGAVAAASGKLTPKQKLAVSRHQAAVAKSQQMKRVAEAAGKKARATVVDLAKKMKAQKTTADRIRGKKGKTTVRGLIDNTALGYEIVGALNDYYDRVGAAPDPSNPGFLDDGSADPAYAPADGLAASSTDAAMADLTSPAASDPVSLPPPPPMNQFIADMATVGGIPYDGSKGTPDGYCGSYGLFTRETDNRCVPDTAGIDGTEHYGYIFGKFHDSETPGGLPFGDDFPSQQWVYVHGRHILGRTDKYFDQGMSMAEAARKSPGKTNPNGKTCGPLIGNPQMPDFVGMRVDGNGQAFWLPQEAPDWLTFPIKQAAALTAQAEAKAAADAAAAEAARVAAENAAAAEAQAQQEAANALAESQEASAAKVAQSQQETQAQQLMVEQAKAEQTSQAAQLMQEQQAQQLMVEQARAQMQQEQQANNLLLQQAQRRQEYLAQHPELEYQQQGGGQGPDDESQYQGEGGGQYQEEGQGGDYANDTRGGYMGQPDDGQDGGDYGDQQ